jgi:hypothetical protein
LQTSALPLGYAALNNDEGGRMKDVLSPKLSVAESATENLGPKTTTILHPSAFILEFGAGDEI